MNDPYAAFKAAGRGVRLERAAEGGYTATVYSGHHDPVEAPGATPEAALSAVAALVGISA